MTQPPSILVVDDDDSMREMLCDYLGDVLDFDVDSAADAEQALTGPLAARRFAMVLSDINMPGMRGFELLRIVRERWPDTKRMLITAYNVEDYIDLIMEHDVGNIFVKTSPFNFDELRTTMSSLLSGDIFGLHRYFRGATRRHCFSVAANSDIEEHARRVMELLPAVSRSELFRLAITEILMNAVMHGSSIAASDKTVEVTVMADEMLAGIGITDTGGRLSKHDILYWLNRQVSKDSLGRPVGAFDTHGRGLFMTRRFIDRLVVNIDSGRCTEVLLMNYIDRTVEGYKPLYINEL